MLTEPTPELTGRWNGPYLKNADVLKDPWGNPYIIKCGGDLPPGARGIAVMSKGEDGKEGTGDDFKSWEQQ